MTVSKNELLIIGPPPTPNGGLHIGHIAGPYMSADVLRRWRQLCGSPVSFVTGTDDSQSYVVASAAKAGMTPAALAARSTTAIKRALDDSLIDVDGFAPFDAGYEETVRSFLDPLHAAGLFKLVRRALPYDAEKGVFLVEGLIEGECPHCMAESRGALCEACGMPLRCEDLGDPRSVADPDARISFREAEILVFPLESVRGALERYYTPERFMAMRPAAIRIVRDALQGTLPEFPITYPLGWGIDAGYPETPGQVFNAWAEGMPASMYCTAAAADDDATPEKALASWRRRDVDLVYFLGLDNVYFWGVAHLGLLLAHGGRYMTPRAILSNHFYELEERKISTSQGHLVLVEDLLRDYSAAAVRFFLCWSAPETTERSFSTAAMETVVTDRLIEPWNALWDATAHVTPELDTPDATVMTAEMAAQLSLDGFSTAAAARSLAKHLARLNKAVRSGRRSPEEIAASFRCLARLADPILKLEPDVETLWCPHWRPSRLSFDAALRTA